jgi:hypothetical protein
LKARDRRQRRRRILRYEACRWPEKRKDLLAVKSLPENDFRKSSKVVFQQENRHGRNPEFSVFCDDLGCLEMPAEVILRKAAANWLEFS